MKILEKSGINFFFGWKEYRVRGTLSMVVADNLAANALGEFFCNFSTVRKFCRFCNVSKDELKEHPNKKNQSLWSKDSFNYSID